MTKKLKSSLSFELDRAFAVAGSSALVFMFLYLAPTLLEAALIRYFAPVHALGAVGDLWPYLALCFLRFRRTAAGVYLLAKATELFLLTHHWISLAGLLWLTDLLPTIACCILLSWLIFFSSKVPFNDPK